jgi:hypothetical protein
MPLVDAEPPCVSQLRESAVIPGFEWAMVEPSDPCDPFGDDVAEDLLRWWELRGMGHADGVDLSQAEDWLFDGRDSLVPRSRVRAWLLDEPVKGVPYVMARDVFSKPRDRRVPPAERYPPVDRYPAVVGVLGIYAECSGSIVAPGAVLTARHCLPAIEVVLGPDLDIGQTADAGRGLHVAVERAAPHPDPRVDAALLFLEAQPLIGPIPRRRPGDDAPPADRLVVVGYGATRSDRSGTHGVKGSWKVVLSEGWGCPDFSGCRAGLEFFADPHPTDPFGGDTCHGDSGGPLLELLGSDADGEELWRLVGLTSRAAGDLGRECGEGGIYVRIDALSPWLDDELRRWSSRARGRLTPIY